MEHDHAGHDHAAMIADFRRRFWVSAVLTIPVLILSPMIQRFLGLREALAFPGSNYLAPRYFTSKNAAAGATHIVLDLPVGPTAKVRSGEAARRLGDRLVKVGIALGLEVRIAQTGGLQPVGRGIGPALEAPDVLMVLHVEITVPDMEP